VSLVLTLHFGVQGPEKCGYYQWQKEYFDDLVAAKVIQVFDGEHDHEIEEEQSADLQPVLLAPEAVGGKEKRQDVKAKLDKIFKLVCVLFVLVVALIGMFVGKAMK
jgi:hypothetical protein